MFSKRATVEVSMVEDTESEMMLGSQKKDNLSRGHCQLGALLCPGAWQL